MTLLAARIAHPLGLKADDAGGLLRSLGAGATALVVLVAGIWAIVTFIYPPSLASSKDQGSKGSKIAHHWQGHPAAATC